MGAVVGALWKRPSSYQDLWQLRETAILAAGKLADFIGLGHHSAKAIFRILGHDRIIGVTAGDNGPGLRIDFELGVIEKMQQSEGTQEA